MTDVRLCPACGRQIESGDQFCPSCGAALARTSVEAHTVPGAEPAPAETPWEAVLTQLRAVTAGRFEIEKELGEGGMAAVYLAYEPALDRRVAIKVMSPALLMEKGMVGRFKQEAVTIAALKHPNIVTVHGVEHHDQLHFFVLDFVEQGSLDAVMRRYGPLPVPVVKAWLAQVASGLEYAHRRGVVHRDIKPANVLLDSEGNAIVTDFGIAKVTERAGFTMTGATVGTPSYMSPEQCLAKPVTGASDQYSLGIVAYAMLTGGPPFRGSTLEIMRAHTEVAPVPVATLRPDCPPDLAQAVMRMLEKDATRRWPNLAEAVAAYHGAPPGLHDPVYQQMAALARGEPVAAGAPAETPTTPLPDLSALARRPRPLGLKLGLGVVGVVATVGVLFLALHKGRAPPSGPAAAPRVVAALDIVPPAPDPLVAGDTLRLVAAVRDSSGQELPGEGVTWTSSDPAVVTVAEGLVRAVGAGNADVTAAAAGRVSTVRVSVREAALPSATLASVEVTPGRFSLGVGDTRRLTAVPLDAAGRSMSGRRVAWSVRDSRIASVSGDGQVTAHAAGTTEVLATIEGKRGTAVVTVEPEAVASVSVSPASVSLQAGQTAQLSAQVLGARGTRIDRSVDWRSANPSVASVSSNGTVTAVAAGVAAISAAAGGQLGQASVTVTTAPAPVRAPALTEADATRLISDWVGTFVTNLDAALKRNDLTGIRRAYQVPLPTEDETEWRNRLATGASWRARPSSTTFPAEYVNGSWVNDFQVEIEAESSGRTNKLTQRFLVVFAPAAGGGLEVSSLRMRLSVRP
jgi:uncharacterized protein YjdB